MIAVGIRLESRGPVFFRQLRMGERLRLFKILKFRTMRASAQGSTLTVFDPELRRHRRPHALEDPRLTRVGAVLRRWSLDELPQLINILRGEMSLVGPRPLSLVESLGHSGRRLAALFGSSGVDGTRSDLRPQGYLRPQSDRVGPGVYERAELG